MVLGSAWVWGVVHTGRGAARPIFTTLLRRGTQLSLVPIVLFMHPSTPGHTLTLPPGEVPLGLLVVGCGTASSPPTILVSLPPTIHQRDTPIPWICLGLTSLQPSIKLRPPERFCQRKNQLHMAEGCFMHGFALILIPTTTRLPNPYHPCSIRSSKGGHQKKW